MPERFTLLFSPVFRCAARWLDAYFHKDVSLEAMRTTLDIPDETYRALKIRAAREGTPVRQIVLRGIQRELAESEERPIRKLQLPLIHSSDPGTLDLTNEQIDELTAFS